MNAELLAGTIAARAGIDPFERALEAGIADATHGRLFAESRRPLHDPRRYALGFELGRYARFDYRGAALPDELQALEILRTCESRLEGSSRESRA